MEKHIKDIVILSFSFFVTVGILGCKKSAEPAGNVQELPGVLSVGTQAPDFTLGDQDGNLVRLADFRGKKNVVLIFYPGDDTPGCTKQLCAARDDYAAYQAAEAVVFGVNPQSPQSHKDFIAKNNYPFPLLVDQDMKVAALYRCQGDQKNVRTVYGIDKNGTIVFAQPGMPETAEILKSLQK
jgi:thioredoxin-dependent peroxiredoxin